MEIKSYKKLKGNLYEIISSDGEKYKIYDDIILKYELLIDKRLDKKKLDKILNENALYDAYFRAVKYINIKMRTALEIDKYLSKLEFTREQIDYAITKLRKDGYINDSVYMKAFINDALNLTLNGPKKIIDTLKKLGLNEENVRNEVDKISSEEWKSRIEKVVEKRAKVNKAGEKVFKNKVYSDLLLLGYYSEDIKIVLDNFVLDTLDVFLKEADKVYNKLSNKYDDIELELRFKNRMFSKGFDSDKISEFLNNKKKNV